MNKTLTGILLACAAAIPTAHAQTATDLVDMGLSVMWSSVNLGATSSTEAGNYYTWGSVNPVTAADYPFRSPLGSSWQYTITPIAANAQYDAATATLGSGWSIPTKEQWQELIDNTTFAKTTIDGVVGVTLKSTINGNTIFIPNKGYMGAGGVVTDSSYGYYFTAERNTWTGSIYVAKIQSYGLIQINNSRAATDPMPIRPVCTASAVVPQEFPVVVGMTATERIEAGSDQVGTIAITQGGGRDDFNKVTFTLEGTEGLDFIDVKVDAARGENITASGTQTNGNYEVTLTASEGSVFATAEDPSDLVTLFFTVSKHNASAVKELKIADMRFFYSDTEYLTPAADDMPLTASVEIVNNAEFTIETDKEVDLGLSVMWSGYSIGATSPEQTGSLLRWGETSVPTDSRTPYCGEMYYMAESDWTGDRQYDAATAKWGALWHTPTEVEARELFDNCESVPYTYNGVKGFALTSKINGKTIFFPAAGMMTSPMGLSNVVADGEKACAMLSNASAKANECLIMSVANGDATGNIASAAAYNGMVVRPVAKRHVPLHVSMTAPESLICGGEAGIVTINQCGGDFDITKVRFTLEGLTGLNVDAITVNPARGENIELTTDSRTEWLEVTLTATNGSSIAADEDELYELLTITLSADKYAASATNTLKIGSIRFYYSSRDYMEAEANELPLTATVEIVNNAEFTVETEQEVDLGLSVLWSGYYLGATAPEGLGDYIQWGSAKVPEKEHSYSADAYMAPPFADWTGWDLFDAATAQWGGKWRTPTLDEVKELIENTETMPYTYKGVRGFAVTSKVNGKTIFMAIGGTRTSIAGAIDQTNDGGEVRTMTATECDETRCWTLGIQNLSGTAYEATNAKYQGMMVRPVADRHVPLDLAMTATATLNADGESGEIAISHIGGKYEFTRAVLTLEVPQAITVGEVKAAEEGAEATAVREGSVLTVTVTCPAAPREELAPLASIAISAGKHQASEALEVSLTDAKFYYADDAFMTSEVTELPIIAPVDIVNNATFVIETDQMVDLGLSVKWSAYAYGSEAPEYAGHYVQWGNIFVPIEDHGYHADAYTAPDAEVWAGNADFDAATFHWGLGWMTPSLKQAEELIENTESMPYTYNGVRGYALTSKLNGKTIFFPAAGVLVSHEPGVDSALQQTDDALIMVADDCALRLTNGSATAVKAQIPPYHGLQVRPVFDESTGIGEITAPAATDAIYDLQGRRLAAPARGINIINGRKTLVK